ncbi:sensor histidine kinase [Mesorhizobium sp. CCNWLW176]|uniref:sensor histidine kinase n=1 Tax=unclassified Mesorhizobium TaxID=325217 RepID=UPI003FA57528
MVHPSVAEAFARARQQRMVGILLAAPFFASVAAAFFLPASLGAATTLTVVCAAFSVAWAGIVLIGSTAEDKVAGSVSLVVGCLALSVLISAAGGTASPMTAMILALPLEAYWQRRTVRSALWSGAAALAVLPLQAILSTAVFTETASVSAWHWLVPLAYLASLLPRIGGFVGVQNQGEQNESHPRLEDIVDAVVFRMAQSGDVADVSAQARTKLHLAPELLLGTGLFDRIHISDRVGYLCALADLRDGAARQTVEARIRLPQRNGSDASDNYRPFLIELMNDGDEGNGFTLLVRENDELAGLRAELTVAAEAAETLELAKGRFLAAVSHELRTPLNAIIGFSDMLIHEMFGGFKDTRQKEYVTLVRDSGHHLLSVVNSILDVSKIESGAYATNPELFRFADAVEMCRSMMSLQAEAKSISLATQIAPEAGEIHADQRAVQQMLINLVSNAIKFTPNGGSVTVGGKRLGSRLHFWVSDNGIGIADDDLCRLGKPFTQVQNDYTRQFEGTGLGLSLVKGLVTLHEGTMSIESALGEGTTVTITLPVAGPAKKEPAKKGALLPLEAGRKKETGHGALRKTA